MERPAPAPESMLLDEKPPTAVASEKKQQDGEARYAEGKGAMTGHIISTTIGGKNGEPKQTISYKAERIVGSGSFGIVFQAKCLETGEAVAIKKVIQDPRYKSRELQLMRSINHPNIVCLKHCFFSTTSRDELYLNIVMEFVPETLYRVLKHYSNAKHGMPLIYVKLYMYQIFRGLAYIHAVGVCHRDLKPQNVLVDPLTHQVKICDFGSAKVLVKGEPNISYICSRYYRALKKRGGGTRSWIRVEAATASVQTIDLDKATMMRRCELPARDLRLLDPLFVYPSTVLGRERAIVVNLEQIRCVITADEVLLLNSVDNYVLQYAMELQRRLLQRADGDELPFEFRALELALEAACSFLDAQAAELEIEAYPLLDELTSKISTLNLERVRRLKSRLVALTRRVQKVRDEIEQLMDDDGDMAEMYLTEKKMRMESSVFSDQPLLAAFNSGGAGTSVSAPVSPVSSPTESRKLEKTFSLCRSRHDSVKSSDNTVTEHIEELEMLLEAYFVVIDSTLNKLTSLKEYIDDTEDFINIQLDNVRNQLIQFELLLTTATFIVAIFGVVAGVFGMNFETDVFSIQNAFQWVLIITGVIGAFLFCFFVWFFKYKRLMPL